MQQLRQLLKQREDEQAGVRLPNSRNAPLDELRRQHSQQAMQQQQPPQQQQQQPPQQQAWAPERGDDDPYAHAYTPSPASSGASAQRARSERQEPQPGPALRERPGSASAVRLAVLSAKHDPRRRPSAQHTPERSPLAPLDTNGCYAGGGFNTRAAVRHEPLQMLQTLAASDDGVHAVDAHGWSALHWAALEGQVEHAAALLDSGAEATRGSTSMLRQAHTHGLDRPPGTLPEDLARAPAEGRRSHGPVLKMLIAAAKGSFEVRREHKRKGDEALASEALHEAREHYNKALRAVPTFMEDSVVFQLSKLRRQVEDAIRENEQKQEDHRQAEHSRQSRSSVASTASMGTGRGRSESPSSDVGSGPNRPPRSTPASGGSGVHRTPPVQNQRVGNRWAPNGFSPSMDYDDHDKSGKAERQPERGSYSNSSDIRSNAGRWSNGTATSTPDVHAPIPTSARSSKSSSTVASSVSSPERSESQIDRDSSRRPQGSNARRKTEDSIRQSEQLSNAVRCGDTKLTVGDAAGAIAAVETGMRACHEMGVADLLRRACAQLESEMRAARDYAHRRDSEVYELSVGKKQAEDDANTIRGSMNDELETLQRSLDDSLRAHEATARELDSIRRDNGLAREDLARAQSREKELRDSWQTERNQMRGEVDKLTDQTDDLQQQLQEHTATKMTADAMCARSSEEILALQRQNTVCEERCRELDGLLRDERETVKRLQETERGSHDEHEKKLEAAKAVVKQWTSKCKQLKEEHAQVLSDSQRQTIAAEDKLRSSQEEVTRLKTELEQMASSWKDEVATLRRDRMKERKRADAEAARASELAQEASRSTAKSDSISSKLASAEAAARDAEAAARDAERLKREQEATSEELKKLRSEMDTLQAAQASDKDAISSLTLERDELAREVDETNSEWQSLQDEMSRLKEQLGQAIHGGEAAFLEANAAREQALRHERELSELRDKSKAEVRDLELEVDRLRKELSSTSQVVDRANRSVEDLQATLQAERSKLDGFEAKAKRHGEALKAAEEAAVRAHEAAEETVRGMMVNFR